MQPQAPMHLIGKLFRFKGQATVFRVVSAYLAAGFIPAVLGHSVDGKHQGCARVADIELIEN
jgi:hypothetical protein